ncbi:MAG: hypothetical protein ACI91R_001543 [Vicingaceae bacterium]|jgi:hypothetical protein
MNSVKTKYNIINIDKLYKNMETSYHLKKRGGTEKPNE